MRRYSLPTTADLSWVEPLPDGHQGTLRTLEAMRWLVRKDARSTFVRQSVHSLLNSCEVRGRDTAPVDALFLFARDGIRYVVDPPGLERVASFQVTTELGYGDCDDKVTWLATALLSQGEAIRFRVQSYDGAQWDHVYLEFYDWSKWQWVALDPTADGHTGIVADIGWRQPLPLGGAEMVYEV